ncbi:MAG: hypothetical protein KatS3mg095_0861 [Candidatus Parcubacteria bacterium]|nr:MAG: hypothetical protein KatS3mg095_0861 [Candidatus Parcubacteria bacterium]
MSIDLNILILRLKKYKKFINSLKNLRQEIFFYLWSEKIKLNFRYK